MKIIIQDKAVGQLCSRIGYKITVIPEDDCERSLSHNLRKLGDELKSKGYDLTRMRYHGQNPDGKISFEGPAILPTEMQGAFTS